MIQRVLAMIARHETLRRGERVIAAVSGGADSVCLLEVLREIAPGLGVELAGIAHVNHKLRGEESDEDERLVAELAARHGLRLFCTSAPAADAPGNLEDAARRGRIDFFASLIRERAADRVATGHTRDDQAETVLFRLLRGSGSRGLAGILPVTNEGLIRPLLDVNRKETREYLRSRNIGWREDTSNRDPRFARNRIRAELLPQLARDWNPNIVDILAHTADIAVEEERWWESEIQRIAKIILVRADDGIEANAAEIAALPTAVARRLVRHAVRGAIWFEDVERVLELAARPEGDGKLELPGVYVIRSFDLLRFGPSAEHSWPESATLQPPAKIAWPGSTICFEIVETKTTETKCHGHNCVSLKSGGELPPLQLRQWRAGDHYRPAGSSRDYSIQELFQRARVPSWRRHSWPIVTSGSEIVWVRQFGVAAAWSGGGRRVLRIQEEKTASVESTTPRSAS